MKEAQRQLQLPLILSQDTIRIHKLTITKHIVNFKGVDRTIFSTSVLTAETCAKIATGIDIASEKLKKYSTLKDVDGITELKPEEYVRQRVDFFVSQFTQHGTAFLKAELAKDKYGLDPLILQEAYEKLYEERQRQLKLSAADRSSEI